MAVTARQPVRVPRTAQPAIEQAIVHGDFLRRSVPRLSDRGAHKEWMHFSISAPQLSVLINFSLMDDLRSSAEPRSEIARLTCAVHTSACWEGDVDSYDMTEIDARAGRIGMRFGNSFVRYEAGCYRVSVSLRKRALRIELLFQPVTIASQVNNIALNDAPPMHWFVVPKLLATGYVAVHGARYELLNVPAYHDHNWGYFRWGQDFSWIWGYGHGHNATCPWTFAFDRLSDRKQSLDLLRGILLWKDERQFRLFGGTEIAIHTQGRFESGDVLRLPRVLALLQPERAVRVPAKLVARAENRGDVLELEFTSRQLCQLITPNDDDLNLTVVNEVAGELRLSGCVRGEEIAVEGRAMFEFLGD